MTEGSSSNKSVLACLQNVSKQPVTSTFTTPGPVPHNFGFAEVTIVFVHDDACVVDPGDGKTFDARIACPGLDPIEGDVVLVARNNDGKAWIIGAITQGMKKPPRELVTRSGHRVSLTDENDCELLEIRDASQDLFFRFEMETGRVVITALQSDLALAAPKGHLDLIAGRGVRCAARDSVQFQAGTAGESSQSSAFQLEHGRASIRGETLEIASDKAELHLGETSFVGASVEATLNRARWAAEQMESKVGQLVEQAKTVHRTVEGLQHNTLGRLRTLVRGAYQMKAEYGSIKTSSELKLDGKKIYLG